MIGLLGLEEFLTERVVRRRVLSHHLFFAKLIGCNLCEQKLLVGSRYLNHVMYRINDDNLLLCVDIAGNGL